MISLEEIAKLIEKADNPLIFYDDDGDGLISYCLIKRKYDKCNGSVVKGNFDTELYVKKVKKYNPDLVIIVDVPVIPQDFVDRVNIPVVWIDHHPIIQLEGVKYFNSLLNDRKDNRPVSYWCYKLVNQDLWLAAIGSIGDWNLVLFEEIKKIYPDLFNGKFSSPGDVIYNSRFGELIQMINFLLKGRVKDVKKNAEILCRINSPYEILDKQSEEGEFIFEQASKIKKKYEKLLEEALRDIKKGKIIAFIYFSGDISLTGDLANELIYRYPKKIIVVAREKNEEMKMSLRSSKINLPEILEKIFKEIPGYGGGHANAVGCAVSKENFKKFLEILKRNI